MKRLALALMLAAPATLFSGPPSPHVFIAPLMRQDLTGQGAFHRLGLLREQSRAVAAQRKAEAQAKAKEKKSPQ